MDALSGNWFFQKSDPHSRPRRSGQSKSLSPVHNNLPLRLAAPCSDMVRDGFQSPMEDPSFRFHGLGPMITMLVVGRQEHQHRKWLSDREFLPR